MVNSGGLRSALVVDRGPHEHLAGVHAVADGLLGEGGRDGGGHAGKASLGRLHLDDRGGAGDHGSADGSHCKG